MLPILQLPWWVDYAAVAAFVLLVGIILWGVSALISKLRN